MLSKILNTGIYPNLDFYQKREVKILNILALVVIVGLLVGSTNIFFLGELYPALVEVTIAFIAMIVFFLNRQKKYEAAAYMFVVSINCTIFFISQYYDPSTDTFLYYFPLIFCIALLHNPNKSRSRSLIFFLIILASFLSSRIFDIQLFNEAHFTEKQNHLLLLYNVYFCVILTIVLVYLFINILNKQYSELTELVDKTKRDQVTISSSLREKEVLLAEVQHRVKNNLAVIIGLLNFQNENAESEETKNALREAKNRVMSIAMVHNQLYRKDDLTKINLTSYLSELIQELLRSHPLFSATPINKDMQNINLEITKTVPLGLIVNEVITNSFKHGFKDNKNPVIDIKLVKVNDTAVLSISDNGIGFPPLDKINKHSLGLTLIESLTDQIDSKVAFSNNNGARVEISFPLS